MQQFNPDIIIRWNPKTEPLPVIFFTKNFSPCNIGTFTVKYVLQVSDTFFCKNFPNLIVKSTIILDFSLLLITPRTVYDLTVHSQGRLSWNQAVT
jgi:hypothetical protein